MRSSSLFLLNQKHQSQYLKHILSITTFFLIIILIPSVIVSQVIFFPPSRAVDKTPEGFGLNYKEITFQSRGDRVELKGWLLPSDGSSTVIMAHGYRNNRLQDDVPALSLAEKLVKDGYNVLMFDFRNCGESSGELTSLGQYEVRDILGAIDYIQQNPDISEHLVLFGFSMGAATSIAAAARAPQVDAVVADSPFADLTTHIGDKSYPMGRLIMPFVRHFTGLKPEKVSPVKDAQSLHPRPLLLIHGKDDFKVPPKNSKKIHKACGGNAQLWLVPGASHLESYNIAGKEYYDRVINFIENTK